MSDTQAVKLLSELKLESARKGLEKTIGLVIKTPNSMIVFLRANKTVSLAFTPRPTSKVFVFAVASSITDGKDFESLVRGFSSRNKNTFSPKELNMAFLSDFLSNSLKSYIYDNKSQRPWPIEMVVMQIEGYRFGMHFIDYHGDIILPSGNFQVCIFGCTDEAERLRIRESLEKLLASQPSAGQVKTATLALTNEYPDSITEFTATIYSDEPTGENPEGSKIKRKPRRIKVQKTE